MIGYFDTSSIVPILIREDNADLCRSLWKSVSTIVTSRVTFVEAHAAVAAAQRAGRIDATQANAVLSRMDDLWRDVSIIEISDGLAEGAAACARAYGLRSLDAIHCASALAVGGVDVVAVSGDKSLLDAWLRNGLAVVDTTSEQK